MKTHYAKKVRQIIHMCHVSSPKLSTIILTLAKAEGVNVQTSKHNIKQALIHEQTINKASVMKNSIYFLSLVLLILVNYKSLTAQTPNSDL